MTMKRILVPLILVAILAACATNPVSVIVPCHRVIREDGSLAGYRWGLSRKAALLRGEQRTGTRTASSAEA